MNILPDIGFSNFSQSLQLLVLLDFVLSIPMAVGLMREEKRSDIPKAKRQP
jgi:hypothetical protein